MMPIQFPESNFTFEKPKGMTDEQCLPLSVFKGKNPDDFPVIISKWQLSKEDLEEINKTGTIWLQVLGEVTPPIGIFTEYPFVKKES